MSYVLLLYTINEYKVHVISKAIGPFDTKDEAMGRPEIQDHAAWSSAAVVTVIPPEVA